MKSLQDALYNWLTIKVVVDERPDDSAAIETEQTFFNMLTETHALTNIEVLTDEDMYYVHYDLHNERKMQRFPRELIEVMLKQINAEPEKYISYPDE